MTSLRDPIREVLQDGVSEETIQRVWRGVRRRREPRARFDRRGLLAVAATALVAVLAFVWVTRAPSGSGPLREANGQTLNALGASTASSTWLADGSRIDTHAEPVCEAVFELFEDTLRRLGRPLPVLLERDDNFPDFCELRAEIERLDAIYRRVLRVPVRAREATP